MTKKVTEDLCRGKKEKEKQMKTLCAFSTQISKSNNVYRLYVFSRHVHGLYVINTHLCIMYGVFSASGWHN